MSNPRYYDPVGRAVRSLLVLSFVCFALASFGILALIVYFATVAIVGAIRGRGQ